MVFHKKSFPAGFFLVSYSCKVGEAVRKSLPNIEIVSAQSAKKIEKKLFLFHIKLLFLETVHQDTQNAVMTAMPEYFPKKKVLFARLRRMRRKLEISTEMVSPQNLPQD